MIRSPSLAMLIAWAVGLGVAACTFPEVTVVAGDGGAGGAGATTGGGGRAECEVPADCPTPDDPCALPDCVGGTCGSTPKMAGEMCGNNLICSAAGQCVQCREEASDCGTGVCLAGQCVPATCDDQMKQPEESDEDCGGPCPPCANDKSCLEPEDCASGVCTAGVCAACGKDSDCLPVPGTFCDDGVCRMEKANGIVCARNGECQSGHCPTDDFVCCDAACDGECEGCVQGKTDVESGTCAPIPNGEDPDDECALGECNAQGICIGL